MDMLSIKEWVVEQVTNNQFFAGAIGGSVMYTAINYAKSWGYYLYTSIKNMFIRKITLNMAVDNDMCKQYHQFLMNFISRPKNIKIFNLKTDEDGAFKKIPSTPKRYGTVTKMVQWHFGKNPKGVQLKMDESGILLGRRKKGVSSENIENTGLSYGNHWFVYNFYTLVYVNISDDSTNHSEYKSEIITTSFLSLRPDKMRDEFQEKFNKFFETKTQTPSMYDITSYGREKIRDLPTRPIDGIFIDDNLKESILTSIVRFYQSVEYYSKMGISPTMGILLYGPPGTGKSSLINAIANEFKCSVHYLSIGGQDVQSKSRLKSLHSIPPYSIIALEDIDCHKSFCKRDEGDQKNSESSLSDILKMLDGTNLPDGTLIIATTNHIDKLDPAVTRFGRFDIKMELLPADKELAHKMIEYLNPEKMHLLDELKFPVAQAELQARILERV